MMAKKNLKYITMLVIGVLLINFASNYIYKRFDLTQDGRYTLSKAAKQTIIPVDSPLVIEVFLEGNFPSEFRRLQSETRQLLEEFTSVNRNVQYKFTNPLEGEENTAEVERQLFDLGLTPAEVQVRDGGKISTERIYPWALAYYNGKTVKIPLLKNVLGATPEERVNGSIQNLEYAFADGFNKVANPKKKSIAIIKGNGELEDREIADFLTTIKETYRIAPFTLDSVAVVPQKTLASLLKYDLIVIAKPTINFNDSERYVLDQYIMNGGASLWLTDYLFQKQDPNTGKNYIVGDNLNLNQLFFKYGIRINQSLIKDVYSTPIVLAQGTEENSQYNKYPWLYFPLSSSSNEHPIVTNIEGVKFEYTAPIELLDNDIQKTVLLTSSPITSLSIVPHEVNFDEAIPKFLDIVNDGPNPQEFSAGIRPLAVLLEGRFTSALKNRVKPFKISEKNISKDDGISAKMVVVSDGDIIKNGFDKNRPLPLGFDKMTQTMYGNKDFLLNTVNFLLDDTGLINIRTKKIAIPFLDIQKTTQERGFWQAVTIGVPLVLLALFGLLFTYFRRKKYAR
ncbi:gliding motility-associated ABC transporter substrate-binding protein GldG [Patiriisocius marinistellae]|uniref:Gliding motility-associated ABC transporter substrate-binding protein GldG n=1 Tax=Patiriisocius marinistellae TaxID=2494560 RepID=A0A5J4FWT1_9FLAO|nr:gliding motility-associated ABC transporter substrate-binding protein GldG [Patiriisocius marinistellae]GEQ87177.1 gliding motility-associated ABC transporter substrate-binding protein GldG [Patiriisocius marinistellae]